eukprot:8621323-Pyramimonas_sp.AAC.1
MHSVAVTAAWGTIAASNHFTARKNRLANGFSAKAQTGCVNKFVSSRTHVGYKSPTRCYAALSDDESYVMFPPYRRVFETQNQKTHPVQQAEHQCATLSDVDGTLLNSSQQLTLRTEEAIRAAHEAGVPTIVATGK